MSLWFNVIFLHLVIPLLVSLVILTAVVWLALRFEPPGIWMVVGLLLGTPVGYLLAFFLFRQFGWHDAMTEGPSIQAILVGTLIAELLMILIWLGLSKIHVRRRVD